MIDRSELLCLGRLCCFDDFVGVTHFSGGCLTSESKVFIELAGLEGIEPAEDQFWRGPLAALCHGG